MAELRRLASPCEFNDFLEQALHDRLVFGVRNEAIQRRLLTEKDPMLKGVVELALSLEAAQKNAMTIQQTGPLVPVPVHKTDKHPHRDASGQNCYCCGNVGHAPQTCWSCDVKCHNCGKVGHAARVCRSTKKKPDAWHNRGGKWKTVQPTKWVKEDSPTQEDVIWQIGGKSSQPYHVTIDINRQPLSMKIDTGAAVSLISKDLKDNLFPEIKLEKSSLTLRTYTSERIPVAGEINVEVQYGTYRSHHRLQVVEGSGPPLLGQDLLKYINLDWANIRALAVDTPPPNIEALLNRYAGVFQAALGTMKQQAHLTLQEGASPRFCRY